jgi:hypothetical protein
MCAKRFNASVPLAKATIQDIQLELIRRSSFNAFDGERVVASLLAHRHLWEAVLMDRLGFSRAGRLPADGLIKLRDLPDNLWNVDTLYVLTADEAAARTLATVCEAEHWGGMALVYANRQHIDDALGTGRTQQAVLSVWWD